MRISDWSSDVCSSDLFSAFGRAAVIIFPNHWPRKACAQQKWSERVSISQIDRRGGVARQSERWMKRTERPSMEDRAAGHLHIRQVKFRLCAGPQKIGRAHG